MITGFLLSVLYALIAFFIALLPATAIPTAALTAIVSLVGFINAYSFLFPVSTLLTVLGVVMTYYITMLVFDTGLWIIHLIRGN